MASARLRELRREVAALADPERAEGVARFFKTGKGEYGEGDKFLGLYVPQLRALERSARTLSLADLLELLHSKWHEQRALALMAFVERHKRGSAAERDEILRLYLANTAFINNWDLVDDRRALDGRRARSHSQSDRLDAARSGEARRRGVARISREARGDDAEDGAQVRKSSGWSPLSARGDGRYSGRA